MFHDLSSKSATLRNRVDEADLNPLSFLLQSGRLSGAEPPSTHSLTWERSYQRHGRVGRRSWSCGYFLLKDEGSCVSSRLPLCS
jgi:hypothetical protein